MRSVILVAGGQGMRMKTDVPKQFLLLNEKPLLYHSIMAFFRFDNNIEITVVLPESHVAYWKELSETLSDLPKHQLVIGGETRFHSVKNGLETANGKVIAVHDAVRPCVSQKTIALVFDSAEKGNCTVPVIEANETIRLVQENKSKALNRNELRIVQTPQAFPSKLIKQAFLNPYQSHFTDCASVLESVGNTIELTKGNVENIKVTHPGDLELAHYYLKILKN
jgi:2-C-methyl-D-erythritol 4-phosphate cytidylyltransferase